MTNPGGKKVSPGGGDNKSKSKKNHGGQRTGRKPKPTTSHFVGRISELEGHIYDYPGAKAEEAYVMMTKETNVSVSAR